MKIDGLSHPKTKDLAIRLGVPLPHAVGLLEFLWYFVGKQTPRGDIGKWSNGVIAAESQWSGDADEFVETLVACGFLDECPDHRLTVHDWSEHAPRWVFAKLKKEGKEVLSPDLSRHLRGRYKGSEVKGSEVKPREAKTNGAAAPSSSVAAGRFDEFWEAYPKKREKKKSREIWKRKRLGNQADEIISDVQERQARDSLWKQGYIPNPTTYLNGERWEDEFTGPHQTEPGDDARNNAVQAAKEYRRQRNG